MLVLSRRAQQEIHFPTLDVRIRVLKANGTVKLGIDAPKDVRVLRDNVEQSDPKPLKPVAQTNGADAKRQRHRLRNDLQSISMGLLLAREQLKRGMDDKSLETLDRMLGQVEAITGDPASDRAPRTAVVVEDDANERELLAGVLEILGFRVIAVENGLAALESLRSETPDVMILDLRLPDMHGEQVLARIREESLPEFPIYVVSGADKEELAGIQTDGVFQKPLNPQTLISALRLEICAA